MDWSSLLTLAVIGLMLFLMMRRGGGCCGGGHSQRQGNRKEPSTKGEGSPIHYYRQPTETNEQKETKMKTPKLITITAICLSTATSALLAADPSPSATGSGHKMDMQSMMKDKAMMHQMCAQMAKDPAMTKMMCEEMMKNKDAMKTMCQEMAKNPKAKKMCMEMMK